MTTQTAQSPGPTADAVVEAADNRYFPDGEVPGQPVILDLRPLLGGKTLAEIDFELLSAFIEANDLYTIEYNETGELTIMPPMMMPGADEESELIADTKMWTRRNGGIAPSSKVVFRIPNLGGRGPDASWVSPERLSQLDPEQYRTGQICPDFVAEIRLRNDSLAYLQSKMAEYIAHGARLGWLIDPFNRRVSIHRPGQEPSVSEDPETLSGEDVMPGFEFRVRELIFDARLA